MPALMWKKDSKGKLIGRCDAKCYHSKNPVCNCMCDGMNHGVGLPMAVGRIFQHLDRLQAIDGVQVASRIKNLSLFLPEKDRVS